MKQLRPIFLAALTILGFVLASAVAAKPVLDKEYKLIDPPQPQPAAVKGIEVLEFFNYACSHCYEFERNSAFFGLFFNQVFRFGSNS